MSDNDDQAGPIRPRCKRRRVASSPVSQQEVLFDKSLESPPKEADHAVASPGSEPSPTSNEADEVMGTDDLIRANRKMHKKLDWLTQTVYDMTVLAYQDAFQPGVTPVDHEVCPDGMVRKYLCRNYCGFVTVALDAEAVDDFFTTENEEGNGTSENTFERRQRWLNILASGNIEVESLELGEGQRRQTLSNDKGFHLACISPRGFVLGRAGVFPNQDPDSGWLPSMIEYRPFTSKLTPTPKATWSRILANNESCALVSCGANYVAVISQPPDCTVRLYSCSGLLLYHSSCQSGVPITVTSRFNAFILVEQLPTSRTPWRGGGHQTVDPLAKSSQRKFRDFNLYFDNNERYAMKPYKCSLFLVGNLALAEELGGSVHLVSKSEFNLFGDEKLTWIGLSESLLPVIYTSTNRCLALCVSATGAGYVPQEMFQYGNHSQLMGLATRSAVEEVIEESDVDGLDRIGDDAVHARSQLWRNLILEWTQVSAPLHQLIGKGSERELTTFYPISTSNSAISVIVCRGGRGMPTVPMPGQKLTGKVVVPFRLPLALPASLMESNALPLPLKRWCDYVEADPTLSENRELLKAAGHVSLPWQLWDEIRYRRLHLELGQQLWLASLLVAQDGRSKLELNSAIVDKRKGLEIAALKEAMKALGTEYPDIVIEIAHHLGFATSHTRIVKVTRERNEKLLADALEELMEHRAQLKEMRAIAAMLSPRVPTEASHLNPEPSSRPVAEKKLVPEAETAADTATVDTGPSLTALLAQAVKTHTGPASTGGPFGESMSMGTEKKRRRDAEF